MTSSVMFEIAKSEVADAREIAAKRLVWAKARGVDHSIGTPESHLERQFTGVLGELAACYCFGIDRADWLRNAFKRDKPDRGIDFRIRGYTLTVRTTKAPNRIGLIRGPKSRMTADLYLGMRWLPERAFEGHEVLIGHGFIYRADWKELEQREQSHGPHSEPLWRIPPANLRPYDELGEQLGMKLPVAGVVQETLF